LNSALAGPKPTSIQALIVLIFIGIDGPSISPPFYIQARASSDR